MGKVGYKDGRRFFEFGKPPEQQQDPEVVKLMEEMKLENRKPDVTIQEAMLRCAPRTSATGATTTPNYRSRGPALEGQGAR